MDTTGAPGVSITTGDNALADLGWVFSWESTAAMVFEKIRMIVRRPTMDLWIEGLYPYLKPFSGWEKPRKVGRALVDRGRK